jgi:hypothetical protein
MLDNYWFIFFSIILIFIIIRKINNLNKPFNENEFINKYNNYTKIKNDKLNFNNIKENILSIIYFYFGINNI